jgi:hypothetical protein
MNELDKEKEQLHELRVSRYIRKLLFSYFDIPSAIQRKLWEEWCIAWLSWGRKTEIIQLGKDWLGSHALGKNAMAIKSSGLWNVIGVDTNPFDIQAPDILGIQWKGNNK